MPGNLSSTRKTVILRRSCERSRLGAAALVSAYELLTPVLRRTLCLSQPTQPSPTPKPCQRQAGGHKA
jgi:hypothetical protein